jgi:hypothetical protein
MAVTGLPYPLSMHIFSCKFVSILEIHCCDRFVRMLPKTGKSCSDGGTPATRTLIHFKFQILQTPNGARIERIILQPPVLLS